MADLVAALRRDVAGDVLDDRASLGRYATDASIYQMMPLAVVIPRTVDDVAATMAIARAQGVPVLPRGGGTSQCGQTVNTAIVMDTSRHLRRVLDIDPAAATALVEPGIVLGDLNAALKQHGLFFPVDPSTHARCTIGGMAGNNSCGSKSIRYGLMADNVHAIDAILADGTCHRFADVPDNFAEPMPPAVTTLIQTLRALGHNDADEIARRFPTALRRVGGYNIDALTPAARIAGRASLARLLVGSEGTLAFSAALALKLSPIKPRKILGICQFPDFRAAMATTRHIVTLEPEAVELVDRTMIDLARSIPLFQGTIGRMVRGEPDSLLIVEFHGHDDAPLLARLRELETLMADLGYPDAVVPATDAGFQAAIAEVREAGLNIMMSMKGDGKPVSFIEDTAVSLDDLADYTERLNEVFTRHGTKGTWYAHASVGCLHVRPVLNMKDPTDVATMRTIAEECFSLVRAYKGSHSGEHGDGIVRSEFHEPMFGSRIVSAFAQVKDAFDPTGLLNPGKIVRAPKMDDRTLFRYAPGYAAITDFAPVLDWSAHPGPLGGLLGAVEMCNNNGTCRKFDAGTMCPSFRATRDEQHVTRGRANTLRLALTGQLGPDAITGDAVAEAMKLCVSCKGCKRECPTGVDMARMKIEVMAARAGRHGVAAREWLVAAPSRLRPHRGHARAARQPAQPRPRPAPRRHPHRPRRRAPAAGMAPRLVPRPRGRRHLRRPRRRPAICRHVQPLFRAREPPRRDPRAARRRFSRPHAGHRCAPALLRPDLPLCRPGRARPPGSRPHARRAGRKPAGGRSRTILPAHPARRGSGPASWSRRPRPGRPRHAAERVPGRQDPAARPARRPRACARALPSESPRRLPRCPRSAPPGAQPRRAADHIVLLRHGRRLRLPGRNAGRLARHGGGRPAAGRARGRGRRSRRRRRHLLPPPDPRPRRPRRRPLCAGAGPGARHGLMARAPHEIGFRNLLIAATLFILVSVAGTLGYMELFGWSALDAVYMVIITVFTVGYGETRPLDDPGLRVFTMGLIVLGSTGLIFFTSSLVQFMTLGQIDRLIGARRMQGDIAHLSDHTVICGYGRIGRMLAAELQRGKLPFVVVDSSAERMQEATQDHCLAMVGDATEEGVLTKVGIAKARTLATVLPNDATNVFITLSARGLNADLYIIARGEAATTEQKLVRAGADRVVMPTQIGAERIAHLILFPNARDLLNQAGADKTSRASQFAADLSELGVALHEVVVPKGSSWLGRPLAEVLGKRCVPVAIYRQDGSVESPPPNTARLHAGDAVVMVVARQDPVPVP